MSAPVLLQVQRYAVECFRMVQGNEHGMMRGRVYDMNRVTFAVRQFRFRGVLCLALACKDRTLHLEERYGVLKMPGLGGELLRGR
jgi:hypothetical protein